MKTLVLYRPEAEYYRQVDEFINNFKAAGFSNKLEILNIDTRNGISTALLYDVMRYPAILVIREDGTLQQLWEGTDLPTINEVEAYLLA